MMASAAILLRGGADSGGERADFAQVLSHSLRADGLYQIGGVLGSFPAQSTIAKTGRNSRQIGGLRQSCTNSASAGREWHPACLSNGTADALHPEQSVAW